MNELSCGVRMRTQLSFILSQSKCLTYGQMGRKALAILCIALHAVVW